jgi:hypothetical protein
MEGVSFVERIAMSSAKEQNVVELLRVRVRVRVLRNNEERICL